MFDTFGWVFVRKLRLLSDGSLHINIYLSIIKRISKFYVFYYTAWERFAPELVVLKVTTRGRRLSPYYSKSPGSSPQMDVDLTCGEFSVYLLITTLAF